MKNDVFISYRRDGGEYTAKIIRDRLTELGYRVFLDIETLRSGDFNTQLYGKIEECRDFVLILSPNALDRCANDGDWVRNEIEHALAHNKNIIPILLRGFTFPEVLPASLQQLPMKNGLEANSEFFDAFIEKLQTFLQTKPGLFRRIRQNTLVRKTLPLLLALTILLGAVLGGMAVFRRADASYPRTTAEENLTQEALYYVELNLTYYDILAKAKLDALDAAERYLSTGAKEFSELENAMTRSLHTMETTDVTGAAPSTLLLEKLTDSPFPSADFTALHDNLLVFRQTCVNDVQYLQTLTAPDFYLSDSDKLKTIQCYRRSLTYELQAYAYATNQMLLPITSESALDDLKGVVLPELEHIPLRAANWSTDRTALEQAMDECFNNMENCAMELSAIVGQSTQDAASEAESLVQQYMDMGYDREAAEQIVEYVKQGYSDGQAEYLLVFTAAGFTEEQAMAIYDYAEVQGYTLTTAQKLVEYESTDPEAARKAYMEVALSEGATQDFAKQLADSMVAFDESTYKARLMFCPLRSDDIDILWAKVVYLKSCFLYDEANECLDLFLQAMEGDPDAPIYTDSVRLFLQQIEETGIDYGVLVTGFTEEGHEVLALGDIIIAVNGQECRTVEDYQAAKAALTEADYTVTVLRPVNGQLEQTELSLNTGMPLIGISSLD